MTNRNPPLRHACSFCGHDINEVELLFRSQLGGLPAAICEGCIEPYHEVVTMHRHSPERAAELVAAINARVAKARRPGRAV
jgi:hypothetical protein